ncbi:MAG: hypothetical protein HY904_23125 [Deltaproteobacteria bacterium]|nr:hypothetical protein [Deltaproteobacteria bacterium]
MSQSEVPVLLGVVLPDLRSFGLLVQEVAKSPCVRSTEFTFGPPLYKGTPQIVGELGRAFSGIDKFDVYFRNALLDEAQRQHLAAAFRRQYLAARPRSEGQDVYLASGDVLGFAFELHTPGNFPAPEAAFRACEGFSHDPAVLAACRKRDVVAPKLLAGRLKVFLEGPRNTRRLEVPAVQTMVTRKALRDPHVFELAITGALPGLFVCCVEPLARQLGGGLALLPG